MRIVSLLPSATEIISVLGLDDQLVGVTHECDWPASVKRLPKVTRTLIPTDASSAEIDALVRDRIGAQSALYTLDMEVLEELRPDLIVTQALCDVCAVAEDEVKNAACSLPGTPRVALLEWLDPPFSTGHWNPELVRLAGGVDGLGQEGKKSVTLKWQQIIDDQPEVVLISCCGFTIERTMQEVGVLRNVKGWDDIPAVRDGRVWVTDGSSYFSRPGPRLVDSVELLAHVIHPDVFELPSWVQAPMRLEPAARRPERSEVIERA